MKANYQMPQLPANGVQVTLEGALVRLLFDFVPATPVVEEGESAPENMYNCESVDVKGRGYGDIVSAIVNDRYPADTVQAVMANYESAKDADSDITEEKRAEYISEYQAWQAWRAHAKEIAEVVVAEIG